MKIAIEALGIHYFGGGRSATLNLLKALATVDSENEYLVFLSRSEPSLPTNGGRFRQYVVGLQNRLALRLWAQLRLPQLVAGYDLVHFIKNLGVFGVKPPTLITMYDMTTLIYPELFPRLDVLYWRYIQPRTLDDAVRVIAISQNTADDVMRFYALPPEKLSVIRPAYSSHFKPASSDEVVRVRRRYGLPARFVLHLGRIDRKKNLNLLVEAYDRFRRQSCYPGKLVLVGEEYAKSRDETLHSTITQRGLRRDVIFTGPVPDADAPAIFSASEVTVFPSRHEGFGIVPLEALACGAPVITSRGGAVREAVGDAAIMLNTTDVHSLANALTMITTQPRLQDELRRRGPAHASNYSWESVAYTTLNVYRQAYSEAADGT